MADIILTQDAALGFGTRKRGTHLGSVSGSEEKIAGAYGEAMDATSLKDLSVKCELAEGVDEREMLTALRNPQLIELSDAKKVAADRKAEDKHTAADRKAEDKKTAAERKAEDKR